jgi:hypothetical protein
LRSGEVSKPKHLAVFELDQPSVRLFDPDAAPLPAKPEPAEDDNVVAGIAPLVPDELPVPELLVDSSVEKSRSPRFNRLNQDWTSSTASSDIAYSNSPTASRASAGCA